MSVIVKGMEMPKDCYDCPLHNGETGRCNILRITVCDYIPKECPLVEVVIDDLISRQAAIDAVSEACFELRGVFGRCEDALKALPSVQPEHKKGYWIGRPIAGYATVRCSICKDVFRENAGRWNYCPNCGAEMEKKE